MAKKMTAMISQPMNGLTEEEILKAREDATCFLEYCGYEVADTWFTDDPDVRDKALYHLGKSIQAMADVDAVYFAPGWDQARGCLIEHDVAMAYGIHAIHAPGNFSDWHVLLHRILCKQIEATIRSINGQIENLEEKGPQLLDKTENTLASCEAQSDLVDELDAELDEFRDGLKEIRGRLIRIREPFKDEIKE